MSRKLPGGSRQVAQELEIDQKEAQLTESKHREKTEVSFLHPLKPPGEVSLVHILLLRVPDSRPRRAGPKACRHKEKLQGMERGAKRKVNKEQPDFGTQSLTLISKAPL